MAAKAFITLGCLTFLYRKSILPGMLLFLLFDIAFAQDFLVGTYTGHGSEGIYRYHLNPDGSLDSLGLEIVTQNPSYLFLTKDSVPQLVAVNEIANSEGTGTVSLWPKEHSGWGKPNIMATGGAHPCHISEGPHASLLISNYTGGNWTILPTGGTPESKIGVIFNEFGSGPSPRQKASHTHATVYDSLASQILSVNLGSDAVYIYDVTEKDIATLDTLQFKPGSGPRMPRIHPNGKFLYVLQELKPAISVFERNTPGSPWRLVNTISLKSKEFSDERLAAEIRLDKHGRFLYASVRGNNEIHVFSVLNEGATLKEIQRISTLGNWPRFFIMDPTENFVLVGNERSNSIVSFERNVQTGMLRYNDSVFAPTPTCFIFIPY